MADVVLDYNQIIEETPVTGDTPPSSGGLITFQFKCDVNGATDLSNSFFAADIEVKSVDVSDTKLDRYIPDAYDFHAFPMLRCFQSITHIIDGQTVCNTQHPYADALIVEKFLTTHSKSNIENFQALSLMKQIDNGMKEHNIFTFDKPASILPGQQPGGLQAWIYDWAKPGLFRSKYNKNGSTNAYTAMGQAYGDAQGALENVSDSVSTVLFQPPFDLWRLRQPFHGGIHQVQMNLKARDSVTYWGGYMSTTCVGLTVKGSLLYDLPRGNSSATDDNLSLTSFVPLSGLPVSLTNGSLTIANASPFVGGAGGASADFDNFLASAIGAAETMSKIYVDIKRIRFLRRVLRTAVPPQLSNVQYNFTEISMQHGTPTNSGMSQQFLLPSTTFGLIFYWRESTNNYYDQVGVHPVIQRIADTGIADTDTNNMYSTGTRGPAASETADGGATLLQALTTARAEEKFYRTNNLDFDLKDFQFTYGGATYPMQRINSISGNKDHTDTSIPYGWHRLMTLQNQLQGVYNSTMDDFPQSYGHGYGKGVLNRMDPHMMFFPVSRTGNSDNGILQVEYNCVTRKPSNTSYTDSQTDQTVQLVVVALYDAQLNMQYSSNELQQIVLTQFK
jgi:hypothetical protein